MGRLESLEAGRLAADYHRRSPSSPLMEVYWAETVRRFDAMIATCKRESRPLRRVKKEKTNA